MTKLTAFVVLSFLSGSVFAFNCDLVYDEFDSLMNKDFLSNPEKYVSVKSRRMSRHEYNSQQKNKFLLSNRHKGMGIAIIHTNSNTWGKLLFTWGKPFDKGTPTLVIKKAVLFGRVTDGFRPRVLNNLKIRSSYTLDLDTGKSGGNRADIWFHNVDGKEMYIEAVNGATLKFPTRSLCTPKLANIQLMKPIQAMPQFSVNGAKKPPAQGSHKYVVKREILANGHVMLSYSDGSRLERYDGGYTKFLPNGQQSQVLFSTAAPVAFPVEPPDDTQLAWLESHRHNLLGIIQTLVADPDLVQQFVEQVDVSGNVYQSIATRSQTIERLVLP